MRVRAVDSGRRGAGLHLVQRMADLLRQRLFADVSTSAVAAGWNAPPARVCCDTKERGLRGGGLTTLGRHGDPPGRRRRLLGAPGSRSLHPAGLSGVARQLGRGPRPDNRRWAAIQPSAGRMLPRPLQRRGAGDLESGAGDPAGCGWLVAPPRLAGGRPNRRAGAPARAGRPYPGPHPR